jgi:hypothetical protein
MRRCAFVCIAIASLALPALLDGGIAHGERVQDGNVIIRLNAGIAPRRLPRDRPAPVAIRFEGAMRTADGSPLPRVRRVDLGLAGRGVLFTRGLPVCPRSRLRNANSSQALERCGSALVGRGRLNAQVFVPHQAPFGIEASLLAFNGRARKGGRAVWVHAFAADPPVSIVLPLIVRQRPGSAFHTGLVIAVPRTVGPLPHLASFQITLSRRFSYRGKRRSYLSATCPVPPNFTEGFLSVARATYTLAGGRHLESVESARRCIVR